MSYYQGQFHSDPLVAFIGMPHLVEIGRDSFPLPTIALPS